MKRVIDNATEKTFRKWEAMYNMKFFYHELTDTLYISTEQGSWKIYLKKDIDGLLLYHRNKDAAPSLFGRESNDNYHRQSDVKATKALDKLVMYIAAHDQAKEIIAVDYKRLPKETKQQKKYFRQVERKIQRKEKIDEHNRIEALFNSLESNNDDFRKISIS